MWGRAFRGLVVVTVAVASVFACAVLAPAAQASLSVPSTAIPGGHTAAVSPSRLQPWGLELGPAVAVANDGFKSVNSHAGFSPPNLWAPFNSNPTQLQIVAPAGQASAPAPAVSRGVGIEFVNVENSGTTVSYYSGNALLDQVMAPQGATSFVGVLF